MKKRLGFLLASSVLLGGLAAGIAYLLGDVQAVVFSAAALGLCLVPAVGTLLWAEWAFRKSPETYLFMVLGGSGLRMVGVLAGGFLLFLSLPYFHHTSFFLWVGTFYLATLALEMVAMLTGRTGGLPHNESLKRQELSDAVR